MRSSTRGSILTLLAVTSVMGATSVACSSSSSSSDEPPAFASPPSNEEAAILRNLEIDPAEEPIADEGDDVGPNASTDSDPTAQLDEFGEVIIPEPPGGFLENPLFDDEEEEPQIETLSVNPLISPGQLPNGEKVSTITRGPWKCVLNGKTVPGCACKASPLNCQIPNSQTGRNRYLPPAFATEMGRRVNALRAAGQKVTSPVDGGKWHVAEGTRVYDGSGKLRGRLAAPGELPADPAKPKNVCITWADPSSLAFAPAPGMCAKINFGGKKRMAPDGGPEGTYVYGFNMLINLSSPTGLDVSGWIPLAAIVPPDREALRTMPTAAGRKIKRAESFSRTSYVVKSAKDWGQTPATFTATKLPTYAESKVAPGVDANRKIGDYLTKDGNVWNLAYNTPGIGGIGTDTFIVEHQSLGFRRVKSTGDRPTLVRVRVYGNPAKRSIVFAYGSVKGRFGWAALDAIKTGTPVSGGADGGNAGLDGYCTGKPDGTYCNENASILGYICRAGQIDKALRCPAPLTTCTGPTPDGAGLVCTP